MVRFGVGLISIIFIFMAFERQVLSEATFKQEETWIKTGLKSQDIANLFQNFSCKNSQKTFLACVNSLNAMANYIGQKVTWLEGKGLRLEPGKNSLSTEKERLEVWVNYYKSNKHIGMNFDTVWTELDRQISSHRFVSYIVGQGINAYLSIHRDPHSYIVPKEYYEKVVANSRPRINSYGFNLGKVGVEVVFARIYPGSLFEGLGVSKGDVILELDGKKLAGMDLESVSELLKKKDKHLFKVKMPGKTQSWLLDKKNQILPAMALKRLPRENNKTLHLISIYKISDGICRSVEKGIQAALNQKTSGVILDLRDNSGGSMDEVLCLSGLFVGNKKIYDLVYFDRRYRKETFYSDRDAKYFGPLVVLVNRATASSAEILAGVVQHYERGLVVGERTFGKGSFQEGEDWAKNKQLLYFQTKGTFHLPSGRSPQLLGIVPDLEVSETIASNSQREEELYLYPIGNREPREKVSKRLASVNECPSLKKEALTGDRLLGKALGHIDCIQF
ncbi:MAG: hypothetical protein JNL11_15775 [Bdellovibrionaceae bacterium]|nr:hypothetical protein [Pseudobdellovibrionaceae bacterium]